MSKHFKTVLLATLAVAFVASDAVADGDSLIVQLRTDATPGVDFDSVRTVLFDTDGTTILAIIDHLADPARDYGLGIRVFEHRLGPGFDQGGTFFGRTSLLRGGGLVQVRPFRFPHFTGHYHQGFHRTKVTVITVLLPLDFAPVLHAPKVATLEEDNDGSGTVTPGDVLRYTIPFFASHALSVGSLLRDAPAPASPLIPGSVTTSNGSVRRGNLPSDTDVVVRFGSVAKDQTVSVSYLARVTCARRELVNQGLLQLRLAGASVHYNLLTDDPSTPAENDPTVVPVACGDKDPAPEPDIPKSDPPVIPQNASSGMMIESAGLGTSSGAPTLTINGLTVKTRVFAPHGEKEVVGAVLTPEMTEEAGVVPFTLTPADPQLPKVHGFTEIRLALETPQEIAEELGAAVAGHLDEHLGEGLAAFQRARTHAHMDPGSCEALQAELKSDLRIVAEQGAEEIANSGDVALQQAAVVNGDRWELDQIEKTAAGGAKLLDRLMKELAKKVGKINKNGHPQGLLCPKPR